MGKRLGLVELREEKSDIEVSIFVPRRQLKNFFLTTTELLFLSWFLPSGFFASSVFELCSRIFFSSTIS